MDAVVTSPIQQRLRVRGAVQGVGFRPFVYRLAHELSLDGWVRNDGDGVEILLRGAPLRLARFAERLRGEAPPLARIDAVEEQPADDIVAPGFCIEASATGQVTTGITADAAVCEACADELFDPANRRYRYAFTNCTHCGPRFTITAHLPYDRPQTSMARFAMCAACRNEYDDPADRRFHAQPNACPACGPRLALLDAGGAQIEVPDVIASVVSRLLEGEIVALKGLGGFQLVCDARNPAAVARLRVLKHRDEKPFAVMAANAASIEELAAAGAAARELLQSVARPIVLLPKTDACDEQLEGVAPGLAELGVMLPTTPLHWLLFFQAAGAPNDPTWRHQPQPLVLVMTSANPGGEPLVIDNAEAVERLGGIADVFVVHDRDILVRCDDSVVRIGDRIADRGSRIGQKDRIADRGSRIGQDGFPTASPSHSHTAGTGVRHGAEHGTDDAIRDPRSAIRAVDAIRDPRSAIRAVDAIRDPRSAIRAFNAIRDPRSAIRELRSAIRFVRRARGYTPAPIRLPAEGPPVLAVGAYLKNTACLTRGNEAFLSQHIGDLENAASRMALEEAVEHLQRVLQIRPQAVAHDLHPDFFSTQLALRLAAQWNVAAIGVQHHHAHVAAVAAEHGIDDQSVLGLALDGVGFGDDGEAWGGELLRVSRGQSERIGHLHTLPLPGGDRAAREPWRMASAVLHRLGRGGDIEQRFGHRAAAATVAGLLERNLHSPPTSSAGRWFDAAAALLGVREMSAFEGQAAMQLEALAWRHGPVAADMRLYRIENGVLDLLPLMARLADERDASFGAALFHAVFAHALADWIAGAARRRLIAAVACAGGCLLNRLLSQQLRGALAGHGIQMLEAQQVPPNDGGIALGQAWVALQTLKGR